MRQNNDKSLLEFEGLGTRWVVELFGTEKTASKELSRRLHDAVTLFDDTYSRFKSTSLIGQLNANGTLDRPSQELLDMFNFAHAMHDKTGGAFDISVGATLQAAGYGKTLQKHRFTKTFWREVEYNAHRISLPRGTAVDLGGLGKGWLLDRLALLLERSGFPYYIINAGGDIVVSADHPISFGMEHPYDGTLTVGSAKIQRGALAVSSTLKRQWVYGGKTYHHVIDPATKKPSANGVVSTYVRGETGLITDVLATVLLLRPELKEKIEASFGVKAIIVHMDQLQPKTPGADQQSLIS